MTTDRAQDNDWWADAKCATTDHRVFFPADLQRDHKPARTAKKICAGCTVADPCLEDALDNHVTDGIFGGKTPAERAEILREREPESAPVRGQSRTPGSRRGLQDSKLPPGISREEYPAWRARVFAEADRVQENGGRVADVARRHGIEPKRLTKWRQQERQRQAAARQPEPQS